MSRGLPRVTHPPGNAGARITRAPGGDVTRVPGDVTRIPGDVTLAAGGVTTERHAHSIAEWQLCEPVAQEASVVVDRIARHGCG